MKTKQFIISIIFLTLLLNPIVAQEYIAIASLKGKVGFIDKSGRWNIEPVYDNVTAFRNGLAAVLSDGKWGYINSSGEYAIPSRYDYAEPFENRSFAKVKSDDRTYYIGRQGDIVSAIDTGIVIFYEDLAILKIGARYGYITRDSQWKIRPQFEMAWPFNNGFAKVKKDGEWIYIDKTGQKVEHEVAPRAICLSANDDTPTRKISDGKWGFTNKNDDWVILPKFDYVKDFSEELAPARIGDKWGYINRSGDFVIGTIYEDACIFSGGLASVKLKGKYGSLNRDGDLVIKARFDNPLFFFPIEEGSILQADQSAKREIVKMASLSVPGLNDDNKIVYNPHDKRLALIIGNGNYSTGAYLANPENDATSMAEVLRSLGFEVRVHLNTAQTSMRKAIDDFGELLKEYDIGLFFFAGHGIQVKGYNYLIPVDATIESENDVEYNCVDAGRVLSKMEESGCNTNIVILDACRNNPFERSWTRKSTGQGLAFMNAPSGSLVAYATAPGHTASDGTGKNGLYTSSLLKYINTPGLSIHEVFQQVRSEVRRKSANNQTPWESTSLEGNFYFRK